MGGTTKQGSGVLAQAGTALRAVLGERQREIALLFVLLGSTFSVVALVGYEALDPIVPFQGADVANPCGPLGAALAHLLFRVFGYGAWLSFGGMVGSVLALAGRRIMSVGRVAWALAFVVTVLGLIDLTLAPGVHHPPGGLVGEWTRSALESAVGPVGAWLLLFGALVAEVTVAGNLRWGRLFALVVDRLEAVWPHVSGGAARGARGLVGMASSAGANIASRAWVGVRAAAGRGSGVSRRMWSSVARAGGDGTEAAQWQPNPAEGPLLPSDPDTEDRTAVGGAVALAEVEWDPTEDASRIKEDLLDLFPELPPRTGSFVASGTRVDHERSTSPSVESSAPPAVEAPPAQGAAYPSSPPVPSVNAEPTPVPSEAPAPQSAVHQADMPGAKVHRAEFLDARVQDDGGVVAAARADFQLPRLSLLDVVPKQSAVVDPERLRELAVRVEDTLDSFKVTGEVTDVRVGPVVTTFEFLPSRGISVRKVANLSSDLAMGLCALSVRIVAPIPGKGVVGIEIPSEKRLTIYLRELLASPAFRNNKHDLPVALGKDVEGAPVIADLAKMPHLLVGGTTGAGKSVGVNGMLMSLLYTKTPSELRLLLIDPKKLEFKIYEDIPHLLHPVVTEPKLAAAALAWACREMDQRYELLARFDTRNIKSYNAKVERESKSWTAEKARRYAPKGWVEGDPLPRPEKLSYIVIVIDELADLMLVAKKDVEGSIARLTQMARACGIHLIVATQRPSVDVVTGLIKSNLPTRISFKLRSVIDSRTVLDTGGAESLLGRGDMLYLPNAGELVRCHGAFVSDDEVGRVVDRVREQGTPQYVVGVTDDPNAELDDDDEDLDELYSLAVKLVCGKGKASTSMVQRHLKIGYNRAARIIEQMEQRGVVGPADGARPREVLVG